MGSLTEPLGQGADGRVIVAIDPGQVNRVRATDRAGMLAEPLSLPSSRVGIEIPEREVGRGDACFAVEATGAC